MFSDVFCDNGLSVTDRLTQNTIHSIEFPQEIRLQKKKNKPGFPPPPLLIFDWSNVSLVFNPGSGKIIIMMIQ